MHYVKYSFVRSEESPMDPKDAAEEPTSYLLQTDHSERNHRSFWQQHSSFGPNVNPEGKVVRLQQMKAVVNPQDHDYCAPRTRLDIYLTSYSKNLNLH